MAEWRAQRAAAAAGPSRLISARGRAHLSAGETTLLKRNHPVVFGMGGSRIYWRAKAAVLALKIAFGDPTGPPAESSNGDPDIPLNQELHQLFQRRHSDSLDVPGNRVLDQRRRLTHQDDAGLMAGLNSPLGHQERERRQGWVIRPVRADIQQLRHGHPPFDVAQSNFHSTPQEWTVWRPTNG